MNITRASRMREIVADVLSSVIPQSGFGVSSCIKPHFPEPMTYGNMAAVFSKRLHRQADSYNLQS